LVGELGMSDRVEFLGVQKDVPARLAKNQLFVLSSTREGFPLSVLEAMRAGLPVVAAAVGGIGEAVIDGTTGFLFPPGDVNKLREKLETVITDPLLRQKMGNAGRERFLKYFTLEKMIEKTLVIYREIITAKTRSTPAK